MQNNSVTIRIIGGLGNQMFQYAAALSLARRKNAKLALDVSGFDSYDLRDFLLDRFTIRADDIVTQSTVKRLNRSLKGRIKALIHRFGPKRHIAQYRDPYNLRFDANYFNCAPPVHVDGYFPSARYFTDIEAEVRNSFKLKDPLSASGKEVLTAIQNQKFAVSLHVRRGDYATTPSVLAKHGILGAEYYTPAIAFIRDRLGVEPHFFIFSDDTEIAAKEFAYLPNKTVVAGNTDIPNEDMILMSQCRHHIIANSTFSWWGAWLNPDPAKIVIAPKQWFTPKGLEDMDPTDIYVPGWVIL